MGIVNRESAFAHLVTEEKIVRSYFAKIIVTTTEFAKQANANATKDFLAMIAETLCAKIIVQETDTALTINVIVIKDFMEMPVRKVRVKKDAQLKGYVLMDLAIVFQAILVRLVQF